MGDSKHYEVKSQAFGSILTTKETEDYMYSMPEKPASGLKRKDHKDLPHYRLEQD